MACTILWIVAASHCQLELLTDFAFLRCAVPVGSHSDSHCDDNVCADIESGLCKVEQEDVPIPAPFVLALSPAPLAEPLELTAHLPSGPPPDPTPPAPWQFRLRTALPPRAPSQVG